MKNQFKWSEETVEYIKTVKNSIKQKYGSYDPTYDLVLSQLGDTYEMYCKCCQNIEEHGIYNEKTGLKNPILSTLKDTSATILKITQRLGLDVWSNSKIKVAEADDTEDFIENLIN